ncbi:uncharacterized protein LOC117558522 [Gymnodraco acuticeps]|uniref:Uncharacterized protein LOC117558522 n=1 Tax=Gymnodraco acuticeps TaxID=8218 RepID=A0A6P8VJP8_GYMAC|nr:uncharacterized protein LOC117558522 [Gymnodraco acuticeps]XP_034090664.1 uncharacterized protein LOC117558522 [Gymnodraco acuticeps]
MRQGIELERAVSLEKLRQETEQAKLEFQREKLELIREGKVAADVLFPDYSASQSGAPGRSVDDLNDLKLVPRFNEKDPEKMFSMFERLAGVRGWSEATRVLLLQCVLTGWAQEAYSSLSVSDYLHYDLVKSAVLRAYELVPEAYRQRFRNWKRGDKSHLEFARDISTHFDRWCAATDVDSHGALRDLVILEQFKNSVPEHIAVYISEHAVRTAAEAAALADDYVLTHVGGGAAVQGSHDGNSLGVGAWSGRPVRPAGQVSGYVRGARKPDNVCHYCHERGHWRKDCNAFRAKAEQEGTSGSPRPAMFVAPFAEQVTGRLDGELKPQESSPERQSYLPFMTEGFVYLVGNNEKVRVKILRDTGSFDSFILASALPFSEDTYMGLFIPTLGIGLNVLRVPLHKMMLCSDLFQGEVAVGVRPALPIDGVTMILGNDIAGSRVWADGAPPAIMAPVPQVIKPDKSETEYPDVFKACTVTRGMKRGQTEVRSTAEIDEASPQHGVTCLEIPWSVSHAELVEEQRPDASLEGLRESVLHGGEVRGRAQGYSLQESVTYFAGEPVYQVGVSSRFRSMAGKKKRKEKKKKGKKNVTRYS